MKTLEQIKTELLSNGAKVWEKNNFKRIYVKSNHIKALIDFDKVCAENSFFDKNTKEIFRRMDSEGAWLDLVDGKFYSKKASVQAWLEYDLENILSK